MAAADSAVKTPAWKRVGDMVTASVGLAVAALPMILISLAVTIDTPGPALIRQRRVGQGGREYLMLKFRTFPVGTPQMSKELLRRQPIKPTRVGAWLRRYSLDELPQLLNVLLGDMSLVGPRPALWTQRDLTELRAEHGALNVKPGLTGLAQVSGREDLELLDKVKLDAEYARNLSPVADAKIVLRTLTAVLRGRGNY